MYSKGRLLSVIVCVVSLIAITGASLSIEIPEGIAKALSEGNSRELARHFNNNIELVVLNNEDVYSKSQAELILRDFFSANPPVKFELLHRGGKESSRYAIGNLETKNGDFRIYFLLKLREGTPLIHLFRIERTDSGS